MRRFTVFLSAIALLATVLLVPMAAGVSAATSSAAGFACDPHGTTGGSPTTTLSSARIDTTTPANSILTCLFRGTRLPASFGGACSFDNATYHADFSRRTLLPVNGNTNLLCSGGTVSLKTDLSITKDDGTDGACGTSTTYTIVVTNNGPNAVTGATVNDTFPAGLTGDTFTSVASPGASGNTASGSGAINDTLTLSVGATVTYTVTADTSASALGIVLANTATVTAPAGTIDTDPSNNTATDTDIRGADISVMLSSFSQQVAPGQPVTYFTPTHSNGPCTADVTVHLVVMNGATVVADFVDGPFGLNPGATSFDTVTVTLPANATGTVNATVTVSSPSDVNPTNNTATLILPVVAP